MKEPLIGEVVMPVSAKKVVLTIGGALLIFALTNIPPGFYFRHHPEKRGNYQAWKWGLLLNLKTPLDWFIAGDSSALDSLNPIFFQEKFGGTALSLATTGGAGLPNVAWMIQEHVRRLGPPKNVVILNDATVWTQDFIVESVLIPLPLHRWLKLKPKPRVAWENMDRYLLIRALPLFTPTPLFQSMKSKSLKYEEQYILGYRARSKAVGEAAPRLTVERIRQFEDQKFELTAMNQDAMNQIIESAERWNFQVYIVNQPRHDYLAKEPAYVNFFTRSKTVFENFEKQSAHVHYLREPHYVPADSFFDEIHLLPEGAAEFSTQVTEEIQKLEKRL